MTFETELCRNLQTVFQTLLPGLEVDGNWLLDNDYIKGLDCGETEKMEITVSPRKYDSYTSSAAEFACSIDTTFSLASDADLSRTVEAYELIIGKLEQWQSDINAVKSDLSVSTSVLRFDPVGFRLDGGSFELDRETKTRQLLQQFTIRARLFNASSNDQQT